MSSPKQRVDPANRSIAHNRRARYNYFVIEQFECGIALTGTEVKSIRAGQVSFGDAYARIERGELWLRGLHIAEYAKGTIFNHEPLRRRKLLAHRREIGRLHRKVAEKGFSLVPTEIGLNRGLIKVTLALCRGKRHYDKRETIRHRDAEREVQANDLR